MKLVIVSSLSGAGKSTALDMLEDLGYYCINNIPISLLRTITAENLQDQHEHFNMLAVGVYSGTSPADIHMFSQGVESLRDAGIEVIVVFLEANTEVMLRRYSETRRKHPLTDPNTPLTEAVAKEQRLLRPIKDCADVVIDTSHTNIHELRELIRTRLQGEKGALSILFQSFGFKYGIPDAVDFVFDIRCLPNPHWQDNLRSQTGRDRQVREYLESHEAALAMYEDIRSFLERWLPRYKDENRAYVTVAIGCTGGKHRSVWMTEKLTQAFRTQYPQVLVRHTELA